MEKILAYASEEGFLLNNLYQQDDGQWVCNFRKVEPLRCGYTPICRDATALAVVRTAYDLIDQITWTTKAEAIATIEAELPRLADLLPKQAFNRRI